MRLNNFSFDIKNKYMLIILTVLSFLQVKKQNSLFNSIAYNSNISGKTSVLDSYILSLYGINNNLNVSLINIIYWLIPYLAIIYIIAVALQHLMDQNKKYFYLIRMQNYKKWTIFILCKLCVLCVAYYVYYVFTILVFSIILNNFQLDGFNILLKVLPNFGINNYNYKLVFNIFIFNILILLISTLAQILISFYTNNSLIGFITIYFIFSFQGFIGKYELKSIFMINNYNIMNSVSNYKIQYAFIIMIIVISLLSSLIIISSKKINTNKYFY